MKLPELKSKFKNRYAIRIIAGVLVVTLVATGSSVYSVNAAKAALPQRTWRRRKFLRRRKIRKMPRAA